MTTYNTGNAVPSADPKDLYDNAQALDEAINSTAPTFTDRLGNEHPTLNRAIELGMASADVYPDVPAALAATSDGDYFSVPAAEAGDYLVLFRNESGVAVEKKRLPSKVRIDEIEGRLDAVEIDITALDGRMDTAEDGITALGDRTTTAEGDIDTLEDRATDLEDRMSSAEAGLGQSEAAIGAAWGKQRSFRALLGGFDDAGETLEVDQAGNLVGGPPVVAQLAGETAQGLRAYQASPKRALLSSFDDQVADLIVDQAGNLVGGPVVIEALLAGGGLAASEESRDAVYIEGGVLKLAASAGPQTLADILPSQFVRSAQWRGPAVISAIDRPSLGSETPVAVAKLEDGYTCVIPSGRKLLIVIPSYGQSNSVGAQAYEPPAAMTANPWPDDLLMFDLASGTPDIRMGLPAGGAAVGAEEVLNGANLIGFRPLVSAQSAAQSNRGATALEAVGFTVQQVAADYLGYQPKVLMFAPGYGSRPLRDLDKGTIPYTNFITALTRAKALADAQGLLMYVPFIVFVHGEGDSTNVNYLADLPVFHADIQDDIKLITGQAGDIPLCHSQASTFFSVEVNGVLDPYKLSKASDILSLSAPYYPYEFASDELHLGNRGLYLGEKMARTVLRDSKLWGAKGKGVLRPASVTFNGTDTIDLVLDVPVGPIVRDTTNPNVNNPAPDNWGFEVHDGTGAAVTISSVTILNGTTIRIVTASTPAAGAARALRYAMTGYPGLQNEGGVRVKGLQPRGQVRDSESTPSIVDGTPLYNWLVHFSESF